MLPEDSDGLAAFYALRSAGFGPEVDIALVAPRGTLLDPARLRQIERLERRVARMPLVGAVTGPGVVADGTARIRDAPAQVARSRRDLRKADDELSARARQLERAQRVAGSESAELARGLERPACCWRRAAACSARRAGARATSRASSAG